MTALHKQTDINISEKAIMIWGVADITIGTLKPHEYGKVILPMTLFKRLNDTLERTKEAVLKKYAKKYSIEVFSESIFQKIFGDVAQGCYEEQMDSFEKLFEEQNFYSVIMNEIAKEDYRGFRN